MTRNKGKKVKFSKARGRTDVVSYRYLAEEAQVGKIDPRTVYPNRSIGLAHQGMLVEAIHAINDWKLDDEFTQAEKSLIFSVGRYATSVEEFRRNSLVVIADKAGEGGKTLIEKMTKLSSVEIWAVWAKCRHLDFCFRHLQTNPKNDEDLAAGFLT